MANGGEAGCDPPRLPPLPCANRRREGAAPTLPPTPLPAPLPVPLVLLPAPLPAASLLAVNADRWDDVDGSGGRGAAAAWAQVRIGRGPDVDVLPDVVPEPPEWPELEPEPEPEPEPVPDEPSMMSCGGGVGDWGW